jgi:hypothetical protein
MRLRDPICPNLMATSVRLIINQTHHENHLKLLAFRDVFLDCSTRNQRSHPGEGVMVWFDVASFTASDSRRFIAN